MQPTRFSGPILYSGRPDKGEVFTDQPLGFNPDFVQYFDDFLGTAIDATNDYSVSAISNGTFASYNRGPDSALPSSDVIHGWGIIQSANTVSNPPNTVDSGAVALRNESVQPSRSRMPVFTEAAVGVSNPKNCDFFWGLHASTGGAFNFDSGIRIGFELDSSDGTGRLKAVAYSNVSINEKVDTGFDMPNASTRFGSFILTQNSGTPNSIPRLTTPVLSIRLVNPFDDRSSAGDRHGSTTAYFYINRQLVATIQNQGESYRPIISSIFSPTLAYEKKSELSGITVGESIVSGDSQITFAGTAATDSNGSGLYSGQIVSLNDSSNQEYVAIDRQLTNQISGSVQFEVNRAQLGTSAQNFSAGTAVDASVGACFVDYMSCVYPRYPNDPSLSFAMVSPEIRR